VDSRFLGKTGLRVSALCFGAMLFGEYTDEKTSHQLLDAFVESGGTFIDTSDNYSRGLSEQILGRWLDRQRREDLVIATKVRGQMSDSPTDQGLSRQHIMKSIDESLRRLRTDYVDLYQIHYWDPDTPIEETLSTMDLWSAPGRCATSEPATSRATSCRKHSALLTSTAGSPLSRCSLATTCWYVRSSGS
jgi:aryl-alcohol dehydrogenase-like predicted oxidoreductase